MELFETLKSVYENSDENILLCDSELGVIWKNHSDLPDRLDHASIKTFSDDELTLPLERTSTFEYVGRFADSGALRLEPLRKSDEIIGYLAHYYSCTDIERLSDRSGYIKFKSNFLGNIRLELSQLISMLDSLKPRFEESGDLDCLRFDREARWKVLKAFSATVNMNELSKYFSGYFKTEYQSLSDICADVAEQEGDSLEANGCMFRYDIEPCVYFEINKERLENVLANLLANAYKYNSKDEKLIELSLKTVNDKIIITVSDNGDGISDERWISALTPFGAFEEYSENEGLGLAIVKCFCDRFGGELSHESKAGERTSISITLPKDERGTPKEFHMKVPSIPNPYDSRSCIMSKGLNPFK